METRFTLQSPQYAPQENRRREMRAHSRDPTPCDTPTEAARADGRPPSGTIWCKLFGSFVYCRKKICDGCLWHPTE